MCATVSDKICIDFVIFFLNICFTFNFNFKHFLNFINNIYTVCLLFKSQRKSPCFTFHILKSYFFLNHRIFYFLYREVTVVYKFL